MKYVLTPTDDDVLHYGTKHHSGRYPYGSGKDPYQDRKAPKRNRKQRKLYDARLQTIKNQSALSNNLRAIEDKERNNDTPLFQNKSIEELRKDNKRLVSDDIQLQKVIDKYKKVKLSDYDEEELKKEYNKYLSISKANNIAIDKYTKADNAAALKRAKEKGQWNVDFLEAVQNTRIFNEPGKENNARLLKEYENYLKDPYDYWKNGRHYLETV